MNHTLRACALAAAALAMNGAQAQTKHGAYVGTFEASGSERDPKVAWKGTIKVNLPLTNRTAEMIEADLLAGDGPPATIKVTQWDYFHREKSADSSGTFVETRCALAAPMEVPATVTGVLNADLKKKNYSMSLTLMSQKPITLSCSSTRQKSFRKTQGIAIALGTGAPGTQWQAAQPLHDPARLAAKLTMDASAASGGQIGPVVQEWDLKLTQ
jgi:hypothetical protein